MIQHTLEYINDNQNEFKICTSCNEINHHATQDHCHDCGDNDFRDCDDEDIIDLEGREEFDIQTGY